MYLIVPFEGVEEMLPRLREMGFKLGVVTSRSRFEFNYDPCLSQWKDLFETVITSDDSERHKPFPDPLLAYLSHSGAVADECIYFGDTEYDYRMCPCRRLHFRPRRLAQPRFSRHPGSVSLFKRGRDYQNLGNATPDSYWPLVYNY
jgi:FMN phosphatase YigB (HAD superfamily)